MKENQEEKLEGENDKKDDLKNPKDDDFNLHLQYNYLMNMPMWQLTFELVEKF